MRYSAQSAIVSTALLLTLALGCASSGALTEDAGPQDKSMDRRAPETPYEVQKARAGYQLTEACESEVWPACVELGLRAMEMSEDVFGAGNHFMGACLVGEDGEACNQLARLRLLHPSDAENMAGAWEELGERCVAGDSSACIHAARILATGTDVIEANIFAAGQILAGGEGGPLHPPGLVPPKGIATARPEFPLEAKDAFAVKEARITLMVHVTPQGEVADVVAPPDADTDLTAYYKAAAVALKQWTFTPAFWHGRPIDYVYPQTFVFRLNG